MSSLIEREEIVGKNTLGFGFGFGFGFGGDNSIDRAFSSSSPPCFEPEARGPSVIVPLLLPSMEPKGPRVGCASCYAYAYAAGLCCNGIYGTSTQRAGTGVIRNIS
ncbi:hypothetical protein SERLA73DRAFT_76800 [Serpula lacrymans var. lacrymans S7.3]|uniref:Uncharacterized protein n=2 Tax=Serpula lacrymans var. lacrymans TaxID=341189 RepID=F8Q839_SERL3|nr:uncharacterized protein SERLADRAFT_410707 [Serpula lacrymans var. lacrymans S7.9]EGN95727.1 hypothetical protein SERLA73DRAFT_76800 [Serpula lacrymans var. lacrymans S7.3]EGO21252.1 hypothetical protein SERLADRAFT_410707 [Serpula lacrymans var. lacrymans S7.9]